MKEKLLKATLIVFALLFLLYPTSYGIIDLKPIFIFLPILLSLFLFIKKFKIAISEKYYLPIILILSVITRIGVVIIFEPYITQVSDFNVAIHASKTLNFSGDYYRVFTHWIMYPYILNNIYKIFGNSQFVALITNAIILIATSIVIYKTTSILFKNKKYGFIASFLYLVWPANILYTLIFTPEHLCKLLLMVTLYLFLKSESNIPTIKKIILYLIIGILLGFSAFFKNFATVFMIAFIIYYILTLLKNKITRKSIYIKVISIIIIIVSSTITKSIVFNKIDSLIGEKAARNIIPCYLNVGLRGNGLYSNENYNMYFSALKKFNYNYDKFNKKLKK